MRPRLCSALKMPTSDCCSDVLDHRAVDFVRHVLQAVHHTLQVIEDFRSYPEVKRSLRPLHLVKTAPPGIMEVVCLALDLRHLFRQATDLGSVGADGAQQG